MEEQPEYVEYVNHMGVYIEVVEKHGFSTEYVNVLINMSPMPELCEYLALLINGGKSSIKNIDNRADVIVITDGVITIDNKKITNMLETFAVWLILTEFIHEMPEIPHEMSIYSYIPEPITIDFPDFDEESIAAEPIAEEDIELFVSQ